MNIRTQRKACCPANALPLLLLTVAFASACSGSGAGDDSSNVKNRLSDVAVLDACALLNKAEVEAALGEPLARMESAPVANGISSCDWYGDESAVNEKRITLLAAIDDTAEQRYKTLKASESETERVPGIGAEAFKTSGGFLTLHEGRIFLQLSPSYTGFGFGYLTILSLAPKALAKAKVL